MKKRSGSCDSGGFGRPTRIYHHFWNFGIKKIVLNCLLIEISFLHDVAVITVLLTCFLFNNFAKKNEKMFELCW